MAENRSQESRLSEYVSIIKSRDSEIEMLQSMLTEANEYRSSVDNQVIELKELQRYMNQLQQQATGAAFYGATNQRQSGDTPTAGQQLENLQQANARLKAEIADLQTQLLDINNRNLQLQQQVSRLAELESLVANFEFDKTNTDAGDSPTT